MFFHGQLGDGAGGGGGDIANHTVICLRVQGTHGFSLSIGYTDFTVITL